MGVHSCSSLSGNKCDAQQGIQTLEPILRFNVISDMLYGADCQDGLECMHADT